MVLVKGDLDITVAFVSTQLKWKEEADLLIKPSIENGLKKDSIIRLSKLATIDKDLAIGLLGRLIEIRHLSSYLSSFSLAIIYISIDKFLIYS